MARLKVAGWQLPHLRGKQVFLALCLGGYGAGLINHGEQYPVLFSALIPTPHSSPCTHGPAWDSSCGAGNCPELQQPPHGPHTPSRRETLPYPLPRWACPSPIIAASCHTARSRFPLVLPAPFLPYTHPLEHSLQFSACMSHHPQSSTLLTPHSAELKGFLRFHSGTWCQWPYLLTASFTVCRLAVKCWLSQSRSFCALLFLLNSYCLAQRTQSKHAEDCAKHTYAWVENWVDGWGGRVKG